MTPTPRQFSITFDYRCPFARNAHEHVLAAVSAGADYDVRFVPFSLSQTHVAEGEQSVWDNPSARNELLAGAAGIVVRTASPMRSRRPICALRCPSRPQR